VRFDHARAFMLGQERTQPRLRTPELHGAEPFGLAAGLQGHPDGRFGPEYGELALERRLDRPRVALGI